LFYPETLTQHSKHRLIVDQPEVHRDPWPWPELIDATRPLPLSFYAKPTVDVARNLLGCVLTHHRSAGMIVEVEAYLGTDDQAAHAYRGITERTRVIFGPPGRAYIYFIYGMHECLNVVAEESGRPGCVLIRALEPLTGLEQMYERRRWKGLPRGLANGPGKLTQALAITREQYGARLDRGSLSIRTWKTPLSFETEATPRIGITHCADWPLRFVWKNHPCLSR
jgi:DNA-3-methyladenine glycosylase